MKITAHVILDSFPPHAKIEHNGKELSFSIAVFQRHNFTNNEYEVFSHINKFWSSLEEKEQKRIFDIYTDISFAFHNIFNNNELLETIQPKIVELLDIHNLDRMYNWISFKSDILIPECFDVEYSHSIDNNTSREKTYTKSDYIKLVTLSLTFRIMIPIWGEYITNIRQNTGTNFKEFFAFQLLSKTSIMHSLAMEKLKVYIEHIVGADKNDLNRNINSISSEDTSFWLLALTCVRRLCIGDIRGNDPKTHLITYIYKFIIQKIRNNDNDFQNQVKFKFDENNNKNQDSENKISMLERYKIKTNLALGEIVELEYSLRDIVSVTSKLTANLDYALLDRSLNTSHTLMGQRLLDPQMTLLRWIFKPAISPRGLMYLPKPIIVNALGALEAVLWARNFKYLALLCTSYAIVTDKQMVISPVESKSRVPKELTDRLDELYPFIRVPNGKKTLAKNVNLAAKSIDILSDNLSMFTWNPTAHDSMLEEVFGVPIRKLPIKPDIKIELTKLVIQIGERSWV